MPVRECRIYRYMGFQCLFRGECGTALQMHTQSVLRVAHISSGTRGEGAGGKGVAGGWRRGMRMLESQPRYTFG